MGQCMVMLSFCDNQDVRFRVRVRIRVRVRVRVRVNFRVRANPVFFQGC